MGSKMIFQWIIYAKIAGTCDETGNAISIGDVILYVPSKKRSYAYCKESAVFKKANSTAEMHMTGYKVNEKDI